MEVPFISLGKKGAVALIEGEFRKFSPPAVKVINSVGSGDSTVAGIAVGLDMDYSISDAIKLGMAAGAANTQFEQTGMVTKELVNKYFSEIIAE